MMINPKRLILMVKKWQKFAAIGRRRITSWRINSDHGAEKCSKSMADKGHFVVYTCDKRRFVFPLAYLNNTIIRELFKMAEDEFGLQSDGPITLPCDAVFMEYVISLVRKRVSEDLERALLVVSLGTGRCSESLLYQEQTNNQLLVQGC